MAEPKTQRQLAQEEANKTIEEYIKIKNVSKQMIPINLVSPKGVNFFVGNQSIYLHAGKTQEFPKSRLMWNEQIINLQKKGMIKIVS